MIAEHAQPHRPLNNRFPGATLPLHDVRHTMFNLPPNTRHIRKLIPTFRRVNHEHPLPPIRNRRR